MKRASLVLVCLLAALGCKDSITPPSVGAKKPAAENKAANLPVDRDNTQVNVRDREGTTKTPIDQNEDKKDVGITADIRKQIVDAKMSTNATNVKVITQDGKVTLRGPVETADEKDRIEAIAVGVAGADKVDSQLEIRNQK